MGRQCLCDRPSDLVSEGVHIFSAAQQETALDQAGHLRTGWCKGSLRYGWYVDPVDCSQIGFVNGISTIDFAGVSSSNSDGDIHPDVCPISQGAQWIDGKKNVHQYYLELRSAESFATNPTGQNGLTVEHEWCRWYRGRVHYQPDPTQNVLCWNDFHPGFGERVSMAGDWVHEGDHSEIHEARIGAAVRPDPVNPNVWHLFASGFFAKGTAQEVNLALVVPIPPPPPPAPGQNPLTKLDCKPGNLGPGEGCDPGDKAKVTVNSDEAAGTCNIFIHREDKSLLSERACNVGDVCPCETESDCLSKGIAIVGQDCNGKPVSVPNPSSFDRCNPLPSSLVGLGTHIAYAGVIRAEWRDPEDLWQCECECDDPSAPGAVIVAPLQGFCTTFSSVARVRTRRATRSS